MNDEYEFCPRCDANLTLQKGYDNNLPYWVCKGCGEMLINPEIPADSDIIWRCDSCNALLNVQEGFSEELDSWKCVECGFVNRIDNDEIYLSDDEFQADLNNPYRGLSDEDILELSYYQDISPVGDRDDIMIVADSRPSKYYIKKQLTVYDKSVYEYLKDNPIPDMPRIIDLYESKNCLIVIEEYIEGVTLSKFLEDGPLTVRETIMIISSLCYILEHLHNCTRPIVHRDIKPSNIILKGFYNVYLLDMNVAKWYNPYTTEDTKYMGTEKFASPEQLGYGLKSSSGKSDIYSVGILMNLMLTGHFPNEEKATGALWPIIEKCISLEADNRYTAEELRHALKTIEYKHGTEDFIAQSNRRRKYLND